MEKEKNYVNTELLYNELIKSFNDDKLTDNAKNILSDMTRLYSNKLRYESTEQHEYCKKTTFLEISKNWKNFYIGHLDEPKYAFNFFTKLIKRSLTKTLYAYDKNLKNI